MGVCILTDTRILRNLCQLSLAPNCEQDDSRKSPACETEHACAAWAVVYGSCPLGLGSITTYADWHFNFNFITIFIFIFI